MKKLFSFCLISAALNHISLFSAVYYVNDPQGFQNALNLSSSNGQFDTIYAAAGDYNLSSGLSYNSAETFGLLLTGAGSSSSRIIGNGTFSLLRIMSFASVQDITVNGLGFSAGNSNSYGGGLFIETSASRIFVNACSFSSCFAQEIGGGAALITNSGDITVTTCSFSGNTSSNDGGGLNAGSASGSIYLSGCTFYNNTANGDDAGGALLYCENGSAYAVGNSFTQNHAQDGGGGLFTYFLGNTCGLLARDNIFSANTAVLDGAGFFVRVNDSGSVSITSNTFNGNETVNWNGGGISLHLNSGTLEFRDNDFQSNYSGEDGGGAWIWMGTGSASINSNAFFNNGARANGGGMSFNGDNAFAVLNKNIFFRDSSGNIGGGLSLTNGIGIMSLDRTTFFANRASEGGGLYYYSDQNSSFFTGKNLISWSDMPHFFSYSAPYGIVLTYSNIQNGQGSPWFGNGCIELYPIFADTSQADLRITWVNFPLDDSTKSPCIDAGDPSSTLDPDGTRADQGALYFNQLTFVEENPSVSSELFRESIIYDPIKDIAEIRFFSAASGKAEIFLLDASGRKLKSVFNGFISPGEQFFLFNLRGFSSGVYFIAVGFNETFRFYKLQKISPI